MQEDLFYVFEHDSVIKPKWIKSEWKMVDVIAAIDIPRNLSWTPATM